MNPASIIHNPPVDWSPERKREYFKWAGEVVEGCRGVNEYLEKEFDRTWRRGMDMLDEETRSES